MKLVKEVEIVMYPDGRMDSKNAALYAGCSEKTLAMKRVDGTGPEFVKRGKIFYYRKAIDAWLAEGLAMTTAQAKAKSRTISGSRRGVDFSREGVD